MRRGLPLQGRGEGLYLRPGGVRHSQGDLHHAGVGARVHRGGEQAGGGRLWRQGGRVGAAPGGAGRPPGEPAREGKAHPAGVHQLPPQAPLYGGHLHPGLRRERHLHRPGLRDPLRHWGLRLPVRAGAGAGLHPLGGPLLLPEHRHPRLRLVHQQPPAGAFRGFGVCQSEFALESNINLLAEKVGISPWEIRFRNAIEPGKALPNGQIADCSTALKRPCWR